MIIAVNSSIIFDNLYCNNKDLYMTNVSIQMGQGVGDKDRSIVLKGAGL